MNTDEGNVSGDGKIRLDEGQRKQAQGLTQRQWLYLIYTSLERRADDDEDVVEEKDRHGVIRMLKLTCSFISFVICVAGFIFGIVQINQANESYRETLREYQQSGAVFSWFDTDRYARMVDSDGGRRQIGAMVISNTGRTESSIIAIRRHGENNRPMTLCMPEFTEDGRLDRGIAPSAGTGLANLPPGGSRLVFFVTADGRELDRTKSLDMVLASGQTVHADPVRAVAPEAMDHYTGMDGWFDAVDACTSAIQSGENGK